jgi:Putative Flp pilus-assembly TadE/G-like
MNRTYRICRKLRVRSNQKVNESGAAFVILAICATLLMGAAAMVIDVGEVLQRRSQDAAAADAGALAGAKGLEVATQMPVGCPDSSCAAAYYALSSVEQPPTDIGALAAARAACPAGSAVTGEVCWRYSHGGSTVDVKTPYSLRGADADSSIVNVRICNKTDAKFSRILGQESFQACGTASAINTSFGQGAPAVDAPILDCHPDNFSDALDQPTIFVFNPGDFASAKGGQILAVISHGFGADLDLGSIEFSAPTNESGPTSTSIILPIVSSPSASGPKAANAKGQAFSLQSLDSFNHLIPYSPGGTFNTVISYQLPAAADLKVGGKRFMHRTSLRVSNLLAAGCGHATWSFTGDGKGLKTVSTSCGENAFFANGLFPSSGVAHPGDSVGAYYTDESPMQMKDTTDPSWTAAGNFGIDFELGGGYFTDAAGQHYQIPPATSSADGYTIGPLPPSIHTSEHFSSTLEWTLPPATDPRWVNGIKYTVYLKAYDTDNNKPGNDCGEGSWSFILSGAKGGKIHLVE